MNIKIPINTDLKSICDEIVDDNLTDEQWAAIESDDTFKRESIVGGYDADESAFCFSYFDDEKKEYWFQFDIGTAKKIAEGIEISVEGRPAK